MQSHALHHESYVSPGSDETSDDDKRSSLSTMLDAIVDLFKSWTQTPPQSSAASEISPSADEDEPRSKLSFYEPNDLNGSNLIKMHTKTQGDQSQTESSLSDDEGADGRTNEQDFDQTSNDQDGNGDVAMDRDEGDITGSFEDERKVESAYKRRLTSSSTFRFVQPRVPVVPALPPLPSRADCRCEYPSENIYAPGTETATRVRNGLLILPGDSIFCRDVLFICDIRDRPPVRSLYD